MEASGRGRNSFDEPRRWCVRDCLGAPLLEAPGVKTPPRFWSVWFCIGLGLSFSATMAAPVAPAPNAKLRCEVSLPAQLSAPELRGRLFLYP